jgi:hypothetical protein
MEYEIDGTWLPQNADPPMQGWCYLNGNVIRYYTYYTVQVNWGRTEWNA